jgi:hypothetical protein
MPTASPIPTVVGPSAIPTKAPSTAGSSSGTGLTGGAIGGIAVACFVGGAVIASLVFFLLTRSRARKNKGYTSEESYGASKEGYSADSKKRTAVTISLPEDSPAAIVENNLPQPKEDNAIIGDLSKLKNKIEGHIQAFYQTGPANDQAALQALPQILGEGSPIPVSRLAGLLSNSKSRPAVLRSALAWVIVSKIGVESNPRDTFLPAQVTGAVHTLPPTRMDETSRSHILRPLSLHTNNLSSSPSVPQQVPPNHRSPYWPALHTRNDELG